jgi:hypothetical protein
VGLLALDVSRFGIVMSADSQPVELFDGRIRVLRPSDTLRNNPIIVRRGGGFTGLVGYVGREGIEGTGTRSWLEHFSAQHPNDSLPEFCRALADALTRQWRRQHLKSALIIFVSGVEAGEIRFWFIHNTQGLYEPAWTYIRPLPTFQAINDLDVNYVARDLAPGQTKEQLLQTRMYFFRNGVLRPSALIFDAFNAIMRAIYVQQIHGFTPIRSLNDLAFFDRQRIEFAKRLYSPKHGISKASSAGIAGEVHVLGVTRRGEVRRYGKHRNHVIAVYRGARDARLQSVPRDLHGAVPLL